MKIGQTSVIYLVSKFGSSLIGFVATVYIVRMLGSDLWGVYSLALAVLAWLSLVGKIGIGSAVTKRISEGEEQGGYLSTGLSMIAGTFAVAVLAVILLQNPLEDYIGASVAGILLIVLFAELMKSFINAVLHGQHLVHIYAVLDPLRTALQSGFQIIVVALGFSVGALLAAYAAGTLLVAVVALFFVSLTLSKPTLRHAKSLFNYAKYSWLGNLKKTSFSWVDITVLGFFVSSGLIGIYSVAWSISAILKLFSSGISKTLFPEISKISSQDSPKDVSHLVTEALRYNGLFLVPGFVGVVLVGDRILLIYGSEFIIGTTILALLVGARAIYTYQKQMVNTLNGINRPDVAFRINFIFIIVNIIFNILLIWIFGWVGAAMATVLASTTSLVHAYYALRNFLVFDLPLTDIAHQWGAALVMGVFLFFLLLLTPPMEDSTGSHLLTVAIVGCGASVYLLTLVSVSRRFRATIARNLPFQVK